MNLLTEPLIRFEAGGVAWQGSLPEVYAALVADRVESFPALRPHQTPAWHMFLVQLGVIAMHRAALAEPPSDAETWGRIIRDLTKEASEPWRLVVDDWTKPAFLQPPVPEGVALKTEAATPDELDMLLIARNHDLKQAVAADSKQEDWIFALISLQTCEGYGGGGGGLQGIARMNKGSSSRVCLGLAPMPATTSEATTLRPGQRVRRDVAQLLARRKDLLNRVPGYYPENGGLALTWTAPWPDGRPLRLAELDILFIEACRRVRLKQSGSRLTACTGTSEKARIDVKQFNGAIGDPWAPVHKAEAKALTLTENGDFDYPRLVDLMLSGEWEPPLLATLGPEEAAETANWLLLAQAFARGNSKTGGFKERIVPLSGRVARGLGAKRTELHQLATNQIDEIKRVTGMLQGAIGVFGRDGVHWRDIPQDQRKQEGKKQREIAAPFVGRLQDEGDRLFFPALWDRFEAQEKESVEGRLKAREAFVRDLVRIAEKLLAESLADLPCPSMRRPRAETRARDLFKRLLRSQKHGFQEYFGKKPNAEDSVHAP